MIRYLRIKWTGFLVWLMLVIVALGWGSPSDREEAQQLYQEFLQKTAAK